MSQSKADTSVTEIITSSTGIDRSEFDEDTELGPGGLDLDSIAVIEVVEIIEMEFDVSIPDDELEDLDTVGDLEGLVQRKLRA